MKSPGPNVGIVAVLAVLTVITVYILSHANDGGAPYVTPVTLSGTSTLTDVSQTGYSLPKESIQANPEIVSVAQELPPYDPTVSMTENFMSITAHMKAVGEISSVDVSTDEAIQLFLYNNDVRNQFISIRKTIASDISTVPSDKNSLETYGEAFIAISKDNPLQGGVDDTAVYEHVIETRNSRFLNVFRTNKGHYETFARKLELMNVPQSALTAHVNLINSSKGLALSLDHMRYALTDPIRGLIGSLFYKQYAGVFIHNFAELDTLLAESGVSYEANDAQSTN